MKSRSKSAILLKIMSSMVLRPWRLRT